MCSLEFPDIETKLWQRYNDRDDVLVLGMAGPGVFGTESAETVGAFQEQTQVSFPLLLQDTTRSKLAFSDAAISPYPLDVILDRDGTIRYLRREFDVGAMEATLEQLLAE
mgnify:CR=1 FL=1